MKKILIASALCLSVFIPAEAVAKKYRIVVEYADPKDPCAVVAGVKRTSKVKKTSKYIRYNTTRRDAAIAYFYNRKRPTCALITPRKTLF